MALVRKSNTRRNLVMIALLLVIIIGGGIWFYTNSQPINLDTGTDGSGGTLRDLSKIQQFNATDFDRSSIFNREDYQSLQTHGTPPDSNVNVSTGVINPFVPSQ